MYDYLRFRLSISVLQGNGPKFRSMPAILLAAWFVVGLAGFVTAQQPPQDDQYKAIARDPKYRATPADVGKGDLYALVVGVSKYKDPGIRPLNVADSDARDFAKFIDTQKQVFKKINLRLLVNEQATREAILDFLNEEVSKCGKQDTVIIFLSGHGANDLRNPTDHYFLGYDARAKSIAATGVKMNGLDFLKALESRRVLLIADACHSGGIADGLTTRSLGAPSLEAVAQGMGQSAGRVILASSRSNQYSLEKEGLPNGVFTYYLLKALRGEADSSRKGVVTLHEAYQYVYDRTRDETAGRQHPQMIGSVEGPFPLAITRTPETPIKLEVSFLAQDPRCKNLNCIDPPPGFTQCNDPLCGDVEMKDGDTMFGGQNFQIAVKPSETCYLYVYHLGAGGDLHKVFPSKDYMAPGSTVDNPIKAGQIFWIPGKDSWLHHDQQVGKEKIYVVASRSANHALEDLYSHLEKLRREGGSAQAEQGVHQTAASLDNLMAPTTSFRSRAVVRSGPAPEDRKVRSFENIATVLEAPGLDAVKSVWFWLKER
jgi:hypothetical protein